MEEQAPQEPSRRRLGRGLSALLGTAAVGDGEGFAGDQDSSTISAELIERNPFQPRKDFDQEQLNELTDSIRQHGVLQPILVRPFGDGYQLIAGERRLIAAKRAGLDQIPSRVLQLSDQQMCEVSLEENLKRQDLNVLEKAAAFQDYLQRFQCTIEELARRLSLDRSTVSNMLRLLDLPETIKDDLRSNKLTAGHARAVLSLSEEEQLALCKRIQEESLSVRKTEEAVRQLVAANTPDTVPFPTGDVDKPARTAPAMTAHVLGMQDQLRDWLGAKVEIKLKGKESGKILIEFKTSDDFERILGRLQRAA